MILTPSELTSLDTALWWWEVGEYTSEAVVILGCAGEFIAEFTDLLTGGDEHRKKQLSKLSLLVLIGGLACGLVCLMRATILSGKIIASLNDETALVRKEASDANERAAILEVRALELSEQILEMGPRDLLLYGKREGTLARSLLRFKGQKVQVRVCVLDNEEVNETAARLVSVFKEAKWNVSPHSPKLIESNCASSADSGLWVGAWGDIPRTERATALVSAVKAIPLDAKIHAVLPVGFGTVAERTANGEIREIRERLDPGEIAVVVLPNSFGRHAAIHLFVYPH